MFQVPRDPSAGTRSRLVLEQATLALHGGDRSDAERLLRRHLLEQPQDAMALAKLAELAVSEGHIEEAALLLRRAAGADPSPMRQMAVIWHLQFYVGAQPALQAIEQLPPNLRNDANVLAIEANCRGSLGDHGRQIRIYQQLAQQYPSNPEVNKSLGDALKTVGRTADALAALRKAIHARPSYGEAWWTLSNFKSYRFSDRDLSEMCKALRGALSHDDALHFHFALGAAFEQRGDYCRSFRHYELGNALRRKEFDRASMRISDFVDEAIAGCGHGMFARHQDHRHRADDPIFVVGLQRSGSTLIEQILASHPMIEGTGELKVMQSIWDRVARMAAVHGRGLFQELNAVEGSTIREMGEEYLERTRPFRRTTRHRFVDKLPSNWIHLAAIRLALPNAKIIDCRRHPMACGFSNFKQNYSGGVAFSYSLESIGYFYRDYIRFMDHFDCVQPGSVHRLVNERLIENPEDEIRRLLEFVGVPFDPACLNFYENKRAIRTPSAEQVRRPINSDGVHHWRNYESWLGPLKDALGTAIDQWDKRP